ncbi:MAG: type IV pilus modification PilV family protein [Bacteroidota bacterium]
MVKLNHKLKASTLVESLIAMVILVVCLGVGTMIYTNVLDSGKQRKRLKALFLINKESMEIKSGKDFLDTEKQIGDWTIKRTVEKFDQAENLYKLELSVIDQNKKTIAVHNELILVE